MSATSEMSSNEEYRSGMNPFFNGTLLAFLNAASDFEIIAIWRIIYYLEEYFKSEHNHSLTVTEDFITNAFHQLRKEGLVEGYFRPCPLHKKTGSSLAIVLQNIPSKGLVSPEGEAFKYFQSVVNENSDSLDSAPLKKTASNIELIKVLLGQLLDEEVREPLRSKVKDLKDELESPTTHLS